MSKERKRLFSYLLALALLLSTVCTGSMTAQAAVLKNGGTTIEATTGNIKVSTNEDRQKVYTLTGDVTNGLTLTLENETAVLNGSGYIISGKVASDSSSSTPALEVSGEGTLIIENATFNGGDSEENKNGSSGIVASGDVNIILKGNITIKGGKTVDASFSYDSQNGLNGMKFSGKSLTIDAKSNVIMDGSAGGNGFVNNYLTRVSSDGGAGLKFDGQIYTIESGADVSVTGGAGGTGGRANGTKGPNIEYVRGLVPESVASDLSGITTACKVTLNYPSEVNTASSSYIIEKNDTVDTSVLPYPEGEAFDFEGWYTNEGYSGAASAPLNITGDTDLYAKYKRVSSTVTFETNGGSSVEKQTVSMSSTATEPTAPTKTGYTFAGWFTNEACTNAYDFNTSVTSDITLYAKWNLNTYTVSFNTNRGSSVASQTVDYNAKAAKPADPAKDGYTFAGWFTDVACTNAYDFNTSVTSDITLYAKWDKNADAGTGNNGNTNVDTGNNDNTDNSTNSDSGNTATYAVSFDTNGGSTIAGQTIAEGGQVTVPNKPSKKNCGFGGWYLDKDCTISYDFTTPVTKDMTLYAKWYTTNFNTSSAVMQKGKSTSVIKAVVLKGDSVKSYKSSNTKVATITKNGKIKAKATGKTTITVTTKKGASAALTLKVQKAKVTTKKITVTNVENDALTLKKGRTFTLKTTLTPLTSQDKVTYSSSNKKVATVSKSGKIKAVKKGTAKITVKSGKKKVIIKVTVKK